MTDIAGIVGLTLRVATVGVAVALPLAFAIAYVLARTRFFGKSLLSAAVMLPLVLPPVVTGLILLDLLGPRGSIGAPLAQYGIVFGFRWTGAALVAGLVALPLIVRPMRLALEGVDPALHEALAVAGHGRVRRFMVLDLPTAWPGIVAGLVLGFAKALGEFGATITFVANIPGETRTLSLAIFTQLQTLDGAQTVFVLSAISIAISVLAVVFSESIVERLTLPGRRAQNA